MLTAALGDPLVMVRAVHFAACTVAMGTLAFSEFAVPRGAGLPRGFNTMAAAAFAVAALSGTLWLVLIARNILDVPLAGVWDGLADVAAGTRFGRVACLRVGLALAGLAALAFGARRAALGAAALLIASIAFTGHAGAGTGLHGTIHFVSDMVHLLAAGVWLGGLPALICLLLANPAGPAAATRRFGSIAMASVAIIAVTGLINTAYLVRVPSEPLASAYNRVLALKLALFAAMLALAAGNRFWLTPSLPRTAFRLAVAVVAETALGLAALILVGALGTLQPPVSLPSSSAPINHGATEHAHPD